MAVFHYTGNIGQGLGATGIFFRVRSEARINVGHEYNTSLFAKRWLTIIFRFINFWKIRDVSVAYSMFSFSFSSFYLLRFFYFIFIYSI